MPASSPHLDQFLRRLHRRLRALRWAEHAGLGLLIGAGFALAPVGLLTWRGAPSAVPSAACLALGLIGGVACGIARRPTALDAAMEADCQLRLADLLGSALLVRRTADNDPWSASVLAAAEAQCAGLSPSLVLLHRLGLRAWGGIGLAASLVLTVALLGGNPDDLRAARSADSAAVGSAADNPAVPPHPLLDLQTSGAGPLAPRQDVQDELSNRTGDATLSPASRPVTDSQNIAEADPSHGAAQATPDGHGGGAGRTDTPHHHATEAPSVESSNPAVKPIGSGRTASGTGAPSEIANGSHGGEASTAVAGSASSSKSHVAPWSSNRWNDDVRRAHEAVDSGRVPPAYQDLVRDYFDRDR